MKPYIIILLLLTIITGQAQQNKQTDKAVTKYINKGLRSYDKADYNEAELNFRKALAKDPVNAIAAYNLGLTQTEQDKNLEAAHYFEKSGKQANEPLLKSKAYFNQGNVWYHKKKYEKAVEAYKNALRQNPEDEEARYNLALAQRKLKQQQKNNKNKNNKNKNKNNKQKKKEQNKQKKEQQDKKNQNKNEQKKNNKNNQNKEQKEKQQGQKDRQKQKGEKKQQKQGQKHKSKLTPQQVKQILVALKNKEQKTQKKIKAKILKGQAKKQKQEKDW